MAERVEGQRGIMPHAEKKQPATTEEIALTETRNFGRPEVLVKFKSGVSNEAIEELTRACTIASRIVSRARGTGSD
jgi:hypothetical protein